MNNLRKSSYNILNQLRFNRWTQQTLNNLTGHKQCPVLKNFHSSHSHALQACLKSRGVLQLQGSDTVQFLQGLVTNDVNNILEKEHDDIQYSLMLNVQGRILYDLFIYNVTGKDGSPCTLLIDVPASVIGEVIAILKKYKIRRKVDIKDVSDEFHVWSQFPATLNSSSDFEESCSDAVVVGPDPRVTGFGKRLIRRISSDLEKDQVDESIYRECRYRWGIPEGMGDLPTGNCFPSESNAVLMNGVSFEKGCYIGQELTARTHYTGVTRKRLMPLVFSSAPPEIELDSTINNEKGRSAGKFRGSQGSFGLGLVRLIHLKDKLSVNGGDKPVSLTVQKPHWWPELNT